MAAIEMIYGEPSFIRLVPGIFTANQSVEIESLGAKIDIVRAIKVTPTFAGATSADSSAKYHTNDGANGNQYSVPDISKNYNILDGTEISADAKTATSKFDVSCFLTPSQRLTLITAYEDGTAVFGIREIGKNALTQLPAGYEYILGKIADFKESPSKGPSQYDFSIIAVSTFTIKETVPSTPDIDFADFNTIATGAGNTIQPDNESARTITAIDATDFTKMFSGKIVIK